MTRIDRLVPGAGEKGRFLLHLSDGSLLKVTEGEVLDFSLYPGLELEEDALSRLRQSAAASETRAAAARLAGARPLSRGELLRRLEEKGAEPDHARAAADWLEELGALNDGEYARTVARHYASRGYGPARVREELRRRQVPRELWDQALEETADSADALDAFLARKLRGAAPDDQAARKRAAAALARRGFSWEDIRSALRRYGGGWED